MLEEALCAAGLPGTSLLGHAEESFHSASVLSFNMPPARNPAAPVARANDSMQAVLTRRNASADSALEPAKLQASRPARSAKSMRWPNQLCHVWSIAAFLSAFFTIIGGGHPNRQLLM